MLRLTKINIALLAALLVCLGCTANEITSANLPNGIDPTITLSEQESERVLVGMWDITIDPSECTLELQPTRSPAGHYDVTALLNPPICEDCIKIDVLEFIPQNHYVKFKLSLKNKTHLTAHDVRGIIIPSIHGFKLLNADSYTGLWSTHVHFWNNPFKAFATDWPNRAVHPNTGHARIYKLKYPSIPSIISVKLVIDASWPGNCKEPYEINNGYATGVFFDYEPQDILCQIHSWQDNVNYAKINLSGFGWAEDTPMKKIDDKWWGVNSVTWHYGDFSIGNYSVLVSARCEGYPKYLHNYIDVTIDATPPSVGWARTWGNQHSQLGTYALATTVDQSDNVYVTGCYSLTADFDPGPGVDEHTSNDEYDIYLTKFDSDGDFQWARTWGGIGGCMSINYEEAGKGVVADHFGNVYVTGIFKYTVDFDPGPGVDEHQSNGNVSAFLSKFDPNGDFLYAKTLVAAYYKSSCCPNALDIDGDGNTYIVGIYTGTIDFDPGPNVVEHTAISEYADSFIVKFDPNGNFKWVQVFGGERVEAFDIAVDQYGNSFITGRFTQTVDFDPGPGVDEHTSNGHFDTFITRYNKNGKYLGCRTWGADSWDDGQGIALGCFNDVIVTGKFANTVDFDPGPDVVELTSVHCDIFISSFNTTGDLNWARAINGEYYDEGYDVAVDNDGNIIITGIFSRTTDFDPGPGIDEHTSHGMYDIFVAKLTSSGDFLWARSFGAKDYDHGFALAVDHSNNVLFTGGFRKTVDFAPGPYREEYASYYGPVAYLDKLNPDGNW